MKTLLSARKFISKIFLLFISLIILISPLKTSAGSISTFRYTLSSTTPSATTTINVTWTTNVAYQSGDSFTITFPAAASATPLLFGQSANLVSGDVSGLPANTTFGSSTTGTLTINATGTVAASTSINITFGGTKITNPTQAVSPTISFTSVQAASSTPDFGSAVASVGSANQVQVTGTVLSSLSFNINTAADGTPSSFPVPCTLGNLSTTVISFCQYRLKVATNAASGFSVSYVTSGGFSNGSYTFTAASGSGLTAGTEAYGANIQPGMVTGNGGTAATSSVGCSSNCTTSGDVFSYQNTSTPVVIYTATKPNNPGTTDTTNTALATHLTTPSSGTASGNYSQTITYNVVASF